MGRAVQPDHLSTAGVEALILQHPRHIQLILSSELVLLKPASRQKAEVMYVLEGLDLFFSSTSNRIVGSQFLVKFTGCAPAEQLWAKGPVFYDY